MSGKKFDQDKARLDLLSPIALNEIARVMGYGAKKYDAHNWRKGLAWSRVYAAVQRHLLAWQSGESEDPETGISHLAHASCGLMFLLEYSKTHVHLDDRYKGEIANERKETQTTDVHAVRPEEAGPGSSRDPLPEMWMDSSKLVRS